VAASSSAAALILQRCANYAITSSNTACYMT
jgi:hypothetical protein